MRIPGHLTGLLQNLYAAQETKVRASHEKDWIQIGEGVCQVYMLSLCLFNFYAEYIMPNAGLREAQTEIKISRRIISYLRYIERGFPGSSDGKASANNVGDLGLIPGWGRTPGERNGNPLQYSCLENPMD